MGQNGMIFTTGSIKQQLANANRDYYGRKTWEGMYSTVDLAKKQQENQLGIQYGGAIADAYAQAYNTNSAISSSNLGQGYKLAAMQENELALEQAYDSYKQNYLAGMSEIEDYAAQSNAGIDAALTQQAEYTKQFANKPYEYLQFMYDKYSKGKDEDNIFLNDGLWSRYTVTEKDENGDDVRRLMTWGEIKNAGARDENGELIGLFDEQGNLTVKGADFYDFMLNEQAQKGVPDESFGDWLAENDEELFNWANSYNPYDYTASGSNLGSFQTMVGMTSTDQTYSFIERYGGMTKNELDGLFKEFNSAATDLSNKLAQSDGYKSKNYLKDVQSMVGEIGKVADRLGITDAIEDDIGMSFESLADEIANYVQQSHSKGDIWGKSLGAAGGTLVGIGSTGYTAAGAVASASNTLASIDAALALGSAASVATKATARTVLSNIPVAGWIAAAVIAAISAANAASRTSSSMKAHNKQLAEASRQSFDNLMSGLVTYTHQQRRQTQSDFYRYR